MPVIICKLLKHACLNCMVSISNFKLNSFIYYISPEYVISYILFSLFKKYGIANVMFNKNIKQLKQVLSIMIPLNERFCRLHYWTMKKHNCKFFLDSMEKLISTSALNVILILQSFLLKYRTWFTVKKTKIHSLSLNFV